MKAKLVRSEGTIEAEGTPEELARLFRAAAASAPAIASASEGPLPPHVHEFDPWASTGPIKCKTCPQLHDTASNERTS